MNLLQLIPIPPDGHPAIEIAADVQLICEATVGHFGRVGYQPPWIGYLALEEGRVVGTCAFKSPPNDGRVEIAYGTCAGQEGRGVATQMARQLIELARATQPGITVTAQTLAQPGASPSILTRLGFRYVRDLHDPEDGALWEWWLEPGTADRSLNAT